MTQIEPIEVKEFISELMEQIEQGVDIEKRNIKDTVDFEVVVNKATKGEAGVKFYVLSGEAGVNNGYIAKVKFSAYPKTSKRAEREINEIIAGNNSDAFSNY